MKIIANGIEYEIRLHALKRMRERYISEATVIETLERGDLIEQEHGIEIYELQYFDEDFQEMLIIRVAVDPNEKAVITVIDGTEGEV